MTEFLKANRSRLILAGIVVLSGCFGSWLWRLGAHNQEICFLDHRPPAQWILYPKPPTGFLHRSAELNTVFQKNVILKGSSGRALLSVRAMKRWSLAINGEVVEPGVSVSNWKTPRRLDVSDRFHQGTNVISVTVFNSNGPPSLWLVLDTWEAVFASGADWEASLMGAAWCKARLAWRPPEVRAGNPLFGGERPWSSVAHRLPVLLVFGLISASLFAGVRRLVKRYGAKREPWGLFDSSRFAVFMVAIASLLWVVLFFNNVRLLPSVMGFDARSHLQYIDYIKTHWRLPLGNEGWEMYQPPLYYIIGALLSVPFNSIGFSSEGLAMLRVLGMVIGVTHFSLVFLSLRLLFPCRVGLQVFGLVLAALLPLNLYLSHYITNEGLSGVLITAAVYFCLRILRGESGSPLLFVGLAVCLGAGLLTKITGLVAVPFLGLALLSRARAPGLIEGRIRVTTLIWSGLLALALCGWHYLRVWRQFGNPLLGNWDPATGFSWWIEDGFHTAGYFLPSGAALSSPWHCGFTSLIDGLYSTMWGDGMWGGMVKLADRPPWNYQLMSAGFLLALFPAALILLGALVALKRFVSQPQPEWFLLLGLAGAMFAAIVYMNLRLPFCGQAKAPYGLPAMLPLCAFGVVGWEILSRRSKVATWAGVVVFCTWAINSYASFWIRRGDPDTQVAIAHDMVYSHREADADAHLAKALSLEPGNLNARRHMAARLFLHGRTSEATRMLESVLKEAPGDAEGHHLLSLLWEGQNKIEATISEARQACTLAPDYPAAHFKLCALLVKAGKYEEALEVGREGLRTDALDPDMHFCMGTVFDHLGEQTNSLLQFTVAAGLNPGWPEAHDWLGQTLLKLHREREASIEFSRAAVALGKAGLFVEAVSAAQRARDAAVAAADKGLVKRSEELIELLLKRQSPD